MQTHYPEHVTIKKFAQMKGYTEDAVRTKIKRGIWRQGKHWNKAPDGRIFIIPTEVDKWITGQE